MNKQELLKQFEKGEVRLDTSNGDQKVDALIYKGLAVHQFPHEWKNNGKWSITHIKSGSLLNCGIGPWPKRYRWKALFLAWALTQEADWTVGESTIKSRTRLKEYQDAMKRAMRYTLSGGKG